MVGAPGRSSNHSPSPQIYCFSAEMIPARISPFCRAGAGQEGGWAPALTCTKRADLCNMPQLKGLSGLKLGWPNSGRKGSVTALLGRELLPAVPAQGSRGSRAAATTFAVSDVPGASGEPAMVFSSRLPFLNHPNRIYPTAGVVLFSAETLTTSGDPSGCY